MRLLDRLQFLIVFSWRSALRHRRRSLLVATTATVGMTGVLFSMGFMNGMMDSMIRGGVQSGLGHTQVRPEGFEQKRKMDEPLPGGNRILEKAQSLVFPKSVQPVHFAGRFEREGLLRIGSYQEGVVLMGIDPEPEKKVSSFDDWIVEGTFLSSPTNFEEDIGIIPCLLGRVNATRMELELGDYVILTLGNHESESVSVRAKIVGLFQSPMTGIDRNTVLVHRQDLSHLHEEESLQISNITFLSSDLNHARTLDDYLEQNRREFGPESGSNRFEILSFFELQPQIETMLNYIDDIKGIIYGVLMSGFGLTLLNSVLMSVFERTREIGIQMAIGTRKSIIVASIIIESLILAVVGAFAGLIVGGGLVALLAWSGIPLGSFAGGIEMMGSMSTVVYPRLTLDDVLLGFYVALGMSVLASIYPAHKATSIRPVDAISGRQ